MIKYIFTVAILFFSSVSISDDSKKPFQYEQCSSVQYQVNSSEIHHNELSRTLMGAAELFADPNTTIFTRTLRVYPASAIVNEPGNYAKILNHARALNGENSDGHKSIYLVSLENENPDAGKIRGLRTYPYYSYRLSTRTQNSSLAHITDCLGGIELIATTFSLKGLLPNVEDEFLGYVDIYKHRLAWENL